MRGRISALDPHTPSKTLARSLVIYRLAVLLARAKRERERDTSLLILYACICIGPTREKFVEITVSSKIRTHRGAYHLFPSLFLSFFIRCLSYL